MRRHRHLQPNRHQRCQATYPKATFSRREQRHTPLMALQPSHIWYLRTGGHTRSRGHPEAHPHDLRREDELGLANGVRSSVLSFTRTQAAGRVHGCYAQLGTGHIISIRSRQHVERYWRCGQSQQRRHRDMVQLVAGRDFHAWSTARQRCRGHCPNGSGN